MTKSSLSPIRTLTLVRNGSSFYPQAETDHQILSELKIPVTSVNSEYFPLLGIFCKRKRVNIVTTLFADLEQAMLTKVQSKWKHDMSITPHHILFVYPKEEKQVKTQAMTLAIQRWYTHHHIGVEIIVKRTSKVYRVMVKKAG